MNQLEKIQTEFNRFVSVASATVEEIKQELDEQQRLLKKNLVSVKYLEQKEAQLKELEVSLQKERALIEQEKKTDEDRKRYLKVKEAELKDKTEKIQRLFAE